MPLEQVNCPFASSIGLSGAVSFVHRTARNRRLAVACCVRIRVGFHGVVDLALQGRARRQLYRHCSSFCVGVFGQPLDREARTRSFMKLSCLFAFQRLRSNPSQDFRSSQRFCFLIAGPC